MEILIMTEVFYFFSLLDENIWLTNQRGLQEWIYVEYHKFSPKVRGERRSLNLHLATKINNLISEVPAMQGLSSDASCE